MKKEINAEYKHLIPYLHPLLQGFAKSFPLDNLGERQLKSFKKAMESDGDIAIAISYWTEKDVNIMETDLLEVSEESFEGFAKSMLNDFDIEGRDYYKVKIIYSDGKEYDFIPKTEKKKVIIDKISWELKTTS